MNSLGSIIFGLVVLINFSGTEVKAHCHDAKSNPILAHIYPKSFGYDKSVMPPTENDQPLSVEINTFIRELGPLQPDENSYRVQITFRQQFTDSRLKHKGKVIHLLGNDVESIWSPDTFFRNERSSELHGTIHPNVYARISENGEVTMSEKVSIQASCPNLQNNLDSEGSATCHLDIASYGLPNNILNYVWREGASPIQFSDDTTSPIQFSDDTTSYLGQGITLKAHSHDDCQATTTTGTYSCLRISFVFAKTSD